MTNRMQIHGALRGQEFVPAGTRSWRAPWLSRRDFLAKVACAGAVGAFTPNVAFAATSGAGLWRMRLSTSSVQFKDLPIELACERIAALAKSRDYLMQQNLKRITP